MSSKVFVGNLAFRMTDQALQEAFSNCGKVKSGVVITRGRRSLGYGFVEFESHEEALKAVNVMNKESLFDRPIKVELAKDPPERVENTPNHNNQPENRKTKPRVTQEQHSLPAEPNLQPKRNRNPRGYRNNNNNNNNNNKRYYNKPKTEKIPSKTTLFVANLPFSCSNEQLKEIFACPGLKDAHVVCTHNGRSRGYGFVEFVGEQEQLAALKTKNGIEVEDKENQEKEKRKITVTISNSVRSTEEKK